MAYAGGEFECALDFTAAGHLWTLTTAWIGDPDLSDLNAAAQAIGDSFGTNVMPWVAAWNVLYRARITHLPDGAQGVAAMSHAGSYNSGEGMPLNVSACVSLHTDLPGRSGRGRFYVSGILTGHLSGSDPNKFTSTAADDLRTKVASFANIAHLNSGDAGAVLGVNSRKLLTVSPYTAITVDTLVDTQRRRVRD